MKARNFTTLAVVVTGALALGAPAAFAQAPSVSGIDGGLDKLGAIGKSAKKQARAAKKSSFQKRTDSDIKRLGNNVADLRKKDDEITSTISSIVSTVTPILTQLGAAATSYANFEYGVAGLTSGGTPIAGAVLVTPRIDPTSEPSTVTGQFTCVTDNNCAQGGALGINTVVRSVNPTTNDSSTTTACSVTASQAIQGNAYSGALKNPETVSASIPGAGTLGNGATTYWPVSRVPLPATDSTEKTQQPFTMVASEFSKATDLMASGKASTAGLGGALGVFQTGVDRALGGGAQATGGTIKVTLSCLAAPKS